MGTLNISLPDSLRTYIEEQTRNGGYSTVSEYVRALIREDQKRKDQKRLESLLLEGLESGEAQTMTREDWEDIRDEVRKRLGKRDRA
jgi:antitoxin ParD1/3/4